MSDAAMAMLAAATWVGAWAAWPVPRWPTAVVCGALLALRRPWLFVVAVSLLAGGLAAAALDGVATSPTGPLSGWATVVADPVDVHGATKVGLRLEGRRLDGWARGAAAGRLRPRLAGEQVEVQGRAVRLEGQAAAFALPRHVGSRLDITQVSGWRPGSAATKLANHLRRHLEAGARPLSPVRRSLVLGVAIGDDRGQSPETTEAFRRAGLSHLLAVSGENVAFFLVLVAPLLGRLPGWSRWAGTLAALLLFAVVTRWEPSVLRAVAMAAVAATALASGRPASRVRLLALATTGLVLADPLLVRSVGFQLSVAATVGIAMLAPGIAGRLPGPRLVGELLAVTVAAQVGVAPVALRTFGSIPLASLPANLLAVPPAGFLTAWGLSAMVLAGGLGGGLAALLRLPGGVVAGWIDGVAVRCAALPLGRITPRWAVVLAGVAGVAAVRGWAGRARAGGR